MKPFPEKHELISFFESEPEILDKDVPWVYNQVRFEAVRNDDHLVCVLAPGYGEIRIEWRRAGVEIVNLRLQRVLGLVVEAHEGREILVAKCSDPYINDLRLRLRPTPHLEWGTQDTR